MLIREREWMNEAFVVAVSNPGKVVNAGSH